MRINGHIMLVNLMPKWIFDRLNNEKKYYSTDNFNKKEEKDEAEKLVEYYFKQVLKNINKDKDLKKWFCFTSFFISLFTNSLNK